MEYWHGWVNWPLKEGWACETCGDTRPSLIWGLVHGVCRCSQCHTQYHMRPDGEIVDVPESMLREEYKEPARRGWEKWGTAISQWDDDKWDEAFELVKEE